MIYAIILFVITYILMLTLGKYRTYITLVSIVISIISGMLPLNKIFVSIDFNVLLTIADTMGLVQLFIDSKMPALLADLAMAKVPNVRIADCRCYLHCC
jgi:Na+/H+ antiporter NhaD/arsenite permease-like protein